MSNTPLNDALKPCAHCGSEAQTDFIPDGSNIIECYSIACGARTGEHDSPESAIAAWNTRANTPESSAAQGAMTYRIEDCGCDGKERFRIYDQGGNGICYAQNREQAENVVSLLTQPSDATAQPRVDLADELCEILSTVLHFIPKEEAQLSDDIHAMCGKLRAAQPSDATAQPINTDDKNDIILRRLAELNEKEVGDLLTEMDHASEPRVDLTDERAAFEAWYEADCMPCESDWFRRDMDGDYHLPNTNAAWSGWRAKSLLANTAQGKP